MARRKPTDIVQLRLRLPDGLRRQIEGEAKTRKLSLNREMVRRLEKSFERELDIERFKALAQQAAMDTVDIAFERLGMAKPFTRPESEQ